MDESDSSASALVSGASQVGGKVRGGLALEGHRPHLAHTPSDTHQTAANEYYDQMDCDGQVGGVICHGRLKGADSTWGTTFLNS